MRRVWTLILSVYLLGWVPVGFASELLSALPSIGRRGTPAVLELLGHAVVAMLGAAAGRMLLIRSPSALPLAAAAVVASLVVALQSLYWTSLPRDVAPGDRLPLALASCAHAAFWLAFLGAERRRSR